MRMRTKYLQIFSSLMFTNRWPDSFTMRPSAIHRFAPGRWCMKLFQVAMITTSGWGFDDCYPKVKQGASQLKPSGNCETLKKDKRLVLYQGVWNKDVRKDIIQKKRDGQIVQSRDWMADWGVRSWNSARQMSAFAMAVYFKGMTTRNFWFDHGHGGEKFDLSAISGIKVDKTNWWSGR